jgi:tetratricopeptide (TPR) repeat protein
LKGEYDGAIADAESAVAQAGMYGDQEACLLYGFAKLRKGDYDGAIAQFDSMIDRGQQKATAYNWRASAKEKKGDWDGAIADYRRAIDTDPNLKNELLPKIEKASVKKNEQGSGK